jgi:hypothetical protein
MTFGLHVEQWEEKEGVGVVSCDLSVQQKSEVHCCVVRMQQQRPAHRMTSADRRERKANGSSFAIAYATATKSANEQRVISRECSLRKAHTFLINVIRPDSSKNVQKHRLLTVITL